MAHKLVVADNSASVQKAIQLAFSNSDFEIYPFEDGLEAFKSILQLNPDAVVLSLSLPLKDGYEVGHYLRTQEACKQTALILLRGAFEPLDWKRLSGLDYDLMFQKPFDSENLALMIKETIEGKQEIFQLPEEPASEEIARPSYPPEYPPEPSPLSPELMVAVEEKIRELVKEEVQEASLQMEKMAKDLVSSEFKKWLVEELKGPKPKR